jgi:hypothetical protein
VLTAALLLVGACADASELADSVSDEPTSTSTAEPEPTDQPTDEPTDEPVEPVEPVEQVERPRAGDCIGLTETDVFYDVLREIPPSKPCSQRHTGQITSVEPLTGPLRRAVQTGAFGPITDRVVNGCRESAAAWLGTDEAGLVTSQFFSLPALPSYEAADAGADWYACTAYVVKRGTTLLTLPPDTRRILADVTNSPYGTCARAAISNAGEDRLVCSIRHNWRAVGAVKLGGPGASFDGENQVRERVRASCETQVRDYLDTTAAYDYGYTWPTRSLWNDGDRYGVCYAKVDV